MDRAIGRNGMTGCPPLDCMGVLIRPRAPRCAAASTTNMTSASRSAGGTGGPRARRRPDASERAGDFLGTCPGRYVDTSYGRHEPGTDAQPRRRLGLGREERRLRGAFGHRALRSVRHRKETDRMARADSRPATRGTSPVSRTAPDPSGRGRRCRAWKRSGRVPRSPATPIGPARPARGGRNAAVPRVSRTSR